jgi:hypothetical protein
VSSQRGEPQPALRLHLGRVGYRGAGLLIFGIIWILLAVAVYADPAPVDHLWHTHLPVWLRMLIWGGPGILAILGARLFQLERWAFGTLFIGPAERTLSFASAMVTEPSISRLAGALVYLCMSALVVLIASWPEPVIADHPSEGNGSQ